MRSPADNPWSNFGGQQSDGSACDHESEHDESEHDESDGSARLWLAAAEVLGACSRFMDVAADLANGRAASRGSASADDSVVNGHGQATRRRTYDRVKNLDEDPKREGAQW